MTAPAYKRKVGDRKGSWTQTAHGRRFWPLDARPGDFAGQAAEIAEQLAKKVRFSGSMRGRFYGNAEHCVLVSEWAERSAPPPLRSLVAWQGLLHDASDAYLVDVPRPIKYGVPAMERGWRPVEHAVTAAIFAAFGVEPTAESTAIVERADKEVLTRECQVLLVHPAWSMMPGRRPADVVVRALEWRDAMELWLARYHAIGGK